ncbi:uncharacterized protein LOC114530141 [Dendronephthya gigantea]|uniref:uncharacterized protein LOC114530141 n=1 Tax=Dendronephthya gigantea TaxID=151771 RepID=UPI00106B5E2B|nr:uncharacterized protein LOC114530141 [Dendronephthya gigantea]
MAKNSDDGSRDADVAIMKLDMTLSDFKLMKIEALRDFLSLRKKSTDGDFETLVSRAFAAWEENVPVDITAEQQLISTKKEYKMKLIIGKTILPDPLTLKKKEWIGEENGGLQEWPPIYYHDIANYLYGINAPDDLLHRLNNDYKEGKSYRYFACDFVKEIFYHPVSVESKICFLKCKVTPSQRTSSTPYNVWVAAEKKGPGGKIVSGYCTCTAGLLGSCNHVTAMLFRIEAAVSSGVTKPTCTSKLSTWNVPAATKSLLSIKPIGELTVVKASYRKRKGTSENEPNCTAYKNFSPYETKEVENPESMRKKIYSLVKDHIPESRFVEIMEIKKKRTSSVQSTDTNNLLSHSVMKKSDAYVYDENSSLENNVSKFTLTLEISEDVVNSIYNNTKDQANSKLWHELRKGRITASKYHNVYTKINSVNNNPSVSTNALVKELIERKKFETVATKHGIAMETHAKEKVKNILSKTHIKCQFQESGMIIDKELPYLSASPDLEGSCKCCRDFVVEIIGVRGGGAGGAAAPLIFGGINLFGQKESCHSGKDVTTVW